MLGILLLVACLFGAATSQADLGDEFIYQCWEGQTTIAINDMIIQWDKPLPVPLGAGRTHKVSATVGVQPSFWTGNSHLPSFNATTIASHCNSTACGSPPSATTCCLYHINIHSCRQPDTCDPWITPANASDGRVLTTATPSQAGSFGTYHFDLALPEGEWRIIMHFKMGLYQCAVGASRSVIIITEPTQVLTIVVSIFGGIIGLVILGAALFLWVRAKKTRNAPKVPPVTLVFTDIQSSTHLWDTLPKGVMGRALDLHNQVMRDALAHFGGYEVKTVGDSFMCAFRDPVVAAQWCMQVQMNLLTAPWSPELLAHENCTVVTDLDSDQILWRGLRVRMGAHYGYPDVQTGQGSLSIDYFGTDVNVAARVEGLGFGGQTLITAALYAELVDAMEMDGLGMPVHVEELGPKSLKGVTEMIEIYQLIPEVLSNRLSSFTNHLKPEPPVIDDVISANGDKISTSTPVKSVRSTLLSPHGLPGAPDTPGQPPPANLYAVIAKQSTASIGSFRSDTSRGGTTAANQNELRNRLGKSGVRLSQFKAMMTELATSTTDRLSVEDVIDAYAQLSQELLDQNQQLRADITAAQGKGGAISRRKPKTSALSFIKWGHLSRLLMKMPTNVRQRFLVSATRWLAIHPADAKAPELDLTMIVPENYGQLNASVRSIEQSEFADTPTAQQIQTTLFVDAP